MKGETITDSGDEASMADIKTVRAAETVNQSSGSD